eukprot:TRINITY_DN7837_c0_g1_i10.p1 TRINITY_DN7837_c0_g1~~TRINITY_DN7837_c0_g1_i10.p1  ORF type:complete len:149 (-),score=47.37 TRINITY_DN7837_c0_g1_i10:47-493(-)
MESQKAFIAHKLKLLEQEEAMRNKSSFEEQLAQTEEEITSELNSIENAKSQFKKEEKELNELQKLTTEFSCGGIDKLKRTISDIETEIDKYEKLAEKISKEKTLKEISIDNLNADFTKAETSMTNCKTRIDILPVSYTHLTLPTSDLV